jgi:hypothetical protein
MKSPSLRSIAKALGVSLSALQEARDTGRVNLAPPVDIEALRAQWVASTNVMGPAPMAERTGAAPNDGDEDLASARRRKEIAAANLKELELERERKTLVEVAKVEQRWRDLIVAARTRLLEIPTRAKQAIPDLTLAEVEEIRGYVHEALNDLAGSTIE